MNCITLSTCQLNQWALDFDGNLDRVKNSITAAKKSGAKFRTGPELELCGYGCEDHFFESDTIEHCWEALVNLLESGLTNNILCDVGMPVLFKGCRYNCRVVCFNGEVVLIRPKSILASQGHYREGRYFDAWNPTNRELYPFPLRDVAPSLSQKSTVIGLGLIDCLEATIGFEMCEELWSVQSPHTEMALEGVEIISNSSASYHEVGKLRRRINLVADATGKEGGLYLYANQIGCDGSRLYYDGAPFVMLNGDLLQLGESFGFAEVEVVTTTVDLADIRSYRSAQRVGKPPSGIASKKFPRVSVLHSLSSNASSYRVCTPISVDSIEFPSAIDDMAMGATSWMWDYLRRSGASGFFLPLSGGADSSAVLALAGYMCQRLYSNITSVKEPDSKVVSALESILSCKRDNQEFPTNAQALCNKIIYTSYIKYASVSSSQTEKFAESLAKEVGCYHTVTEINDVVEAAVKAFTKALPPSSTNCRPRFTSTEQGTRQEDIAMQNLQARLRMVMSYTFACLLPASRVPMFKQNHSCKKHSLEPPGFLLVLSSGNNDEALVGYLTKYDCSSGDLNPIGSFTKRELHLFLRWATDYLQYHTLEKILTMPPSAELQPLPTGMDSLVGEHALEEKTGLKPQTDEEDMDLLYKDISVLGRLRQIRRCGPVSMYRHLINGTSTGFSVTAQTAKDIGSLVKRFYLRYIKNRHKSSILTPAYHASGAAVEDGRFDHRPIVYPNLRKQFEAIDRLVEGHSVQVTTQYQM